MKKENKMRIEKDCPSRNILMIGEEIYTDGEYSQLRIIAYYDKFHSMVIRLDKPFCWKKLNDKIEIWE